MTYTIVLHPDAENEKWWNEHPFYYWTTQPGDEKNASIELSTLYLLVGYKF